MGRPVQLGRYRLLSRLAAGGMGEVFLARHEGPAGFTKNVVVKRILDHLASDASFVDMFVNEARLAALLSHPNIVQIFELGQAEGSYFIAMEFIHGKSLRAVKGVLDARGHVLSPAVAAFLAAQALRALHYAHRLTDESGHCLHVVHRDVSPENILISFGGAVKLVDFGIAKAVNVVASGGDSPRGKFAYCAPEQLRSEPLDGRADVYAMGAVLYELLTGELPFATRNTADLIQNVLTVSPVSPCTRNPRLPPELGAIVSKAMSKDPEHRYVSAEWMAVALEEFVSTHAGSMGGPHIEAMMRELFATEVNEPIPTLKPAAAGTRPLQQRDEIVTEIASRRETLDVPLSLDVVSGLTADLRGPSSEMRPAKQNPWIRMGLGVAAALALVVAGFFAWEPKNKPVAESIALPAPLEHPVPVPTLTSATVVQVAEPEPPTPSTGRVVVRVHPWAEVIWSGRNYGITPIPALTVPAGKQTFLLRNKALRIEKRVSVIVPPGGEATVRANFLPSRANR